MRSCRTRAGGRAVTMTSGSPAARILRFGLPLIAANTLQQVNSMVDAMMLGHFGGVTGLAVDGRAVVALTRAMVIGAVRLFHIGVAWVVSTLVLGAVVGVVVGRVWLVAVIPPVGMLPTQRAG